MGRFISSIIIFSFFSALLFGIHYGAYYLLTRQNKLVVTNVFIKGNNFVSAEQIKKACGFGSSTGIFDFNLTDAASSIKENPLIEDVEINRFPPDIVLIKVKERTPLSVVVDSGKNAYLTDKNGYVISKGYLAGIPVIYLDYPVRYEKNSINDDFVKILLKKLEEFKGTKEIRQIQVKRKEGIYIVIKGLEKVLFFIGKNIPDNTLFNRIESIAMRIRKENINTRFIYVSKENAIGYK